MTARPAPGRKAGKVKPRIGEMWIRRLGKVPPERGMVGHVVRAGAGFHVRLDVTSESWSWMTAGYLRKFYRRTKGGK